MGASGLLSLQILAISAALWAGAAYADDYAELHGIWQPPNTQCGSGSFESWYIGREGINQYDSSCEVVSVKKNGDTFIFTQQCSYGMEDDGQDEEYREDEVRLISRGEAIINGNAYHWCPDR